MKADAINFEMRAVAFLDVLGFKDFVRRAEVKTSEEYRALCELKAVIEAELDVSEFHIKLKPTCTYISDSVILSSPVSSDDYSGLVGVAIKSIQIAHRLLGLGFLVQGCIAVGTVAHDKSNIFGSAYMDAYAIQEEEKMPRIIMHESASEILNSDGGYGGCRLRELSIFVIDGNDWIVDTLNPHPSYLHDKNSLEDIFVGYRNEIIRNLESLPLGYSRRGKWEWMAGFFNDRLERYRGDIRSVEKIDLPMPPTQFRQGNAENEQDSKWFEPFQAKAVATQVQNPSCKTSGKS
jgi:hypothetical protein